MYLCFKTYLCQMTDPRMNITKERPVGNDIAGKSRFIIKKTGVQMQR